MSCGILQALRIVETFEPGDVAVVGLHTTNKMRGTPSLVLIDKRGLIRKHAFGPVEDLRIGAEIGAPTQESAALASRSSAA